MPSGKWLLGPLLLVAINAALLVAWRTAWRDDEVLLVVSYLGFLVGVAVTLVVLVLTRPPTGVGKWLLGLPLLALLDVGFFFGWLYVGGGENCGWPCGDSALLLVSMFGFLISVIATFAWVVGLVRLVRPAGRE